MRIAIVAPCHIQPSQGWIDALDREVKSYLAERSKLPETTEVQVFIIDDSTPRGDFGKGLLQMPTHWHVITRVLQKQALGKHYDTYEKMFQKSSASRNLGHIIAYFEKFDTIIGLDSDCIVPFGFINAHLRVLGIKGAYGWTNPIAGTGLYTRGFPYSQRAWNIAANMGMWENVLDLNGRDRKENEPKKVNLPGNQVATNFLPFSGMNFALQARTVPAYLFLPNFDQDTDEFRRIDDVWGGLIYQHLLRKKHEAVTFGQPMVFHDTVVIAKEDEAEEAAMYKWEDEFMKSVDTAMRFSAPDDTYEELFSKFAEGFRNTHSHFRHLYPAINWWVDVFNDPDYTSILNHA